ncbi:helix-turn-helix domain-containing protein, partial [Stenotrophomonas maltophilia]|nr:helix-turn-helix domain-containing protein [Stenotrophomonas maltophilia]
MYTPSSQRRGRKRAGYGRRRPYVTAEQFRDARIFSGLTRLDAAEMLGVSLRTIGSWELGRARPSWAAFKLLRFLKHGAFIDPAWAGYTVVRGRLITPENHAIEPHDMAWLSLLVRRSRAFSDLLKQRQGQAADAGARAGAAADLGQFSSARGASDGAPSSGREAAAGRGVCRYRASVNYFTA